MNQQTLRIRCFARLRELVGGDVVEIRVPEDCSVEELRVYLAEAYPVLAAEKWPLLVARNGDYVSGEERLTATDDLACFPPVSGG